MSESNAISTLDYDAFRQHLRHDHCSQQPARPVHRNAHRVSDRLQSTVELAFAPGRTSSSQIAQAHDHAGGDEHGRSIDKVNGGITAQAGTVADGYLREGKRFMTVAIGCTGGKHRSVAMSEEIVQRLRRLGLEAQATHRDLGRE